MRTLIYIYILFSLNLNAQKFEAVDFKNGLSQNTVLSIGQDDTGFVWLGTADGLNRFDGKSIRTFRFALNDTNCICGNEVMDIVNDKRGNLWIATSNCLNKLDISNYSFSHYNSEQNNNKALSGNYISQLELLNENLFVVTENGVDVINLETDNILQLTLPKKAIVKNVSALLDEKILVTTDQGLFIYHIRNQQLTSLEDEFEIQYKRENIVRSFIEGSFLFIAYQNELIKYNLESKKEQLLFGGGFLDTRDIKKWNDKIWFCTSKGIMIYDCKTHMFNKGLGDEIPDGVAIRSFIKSDSEIWFSLGTGVLKYCINEALFQTIKVDKRKTGINGYNKVWHICNEGDAIIISTEQGIFFLDKTGDVTPLSGMLPMDISIKFPSNVTRDAHNIWISTFDAGIYHIDLQNKRLHNYSNTNIGKYFLANNTVRHSLQLEDEVLFSTDSGLFSFNKDSKELNEVVYESKADHGSLSNKTTFCLIDSLERLWVGTQNGLYIKTDEGQVSYYSTQTKPALSNNRVRNIYQYSDSLFLIGTSSGLNIFNYKNKTIEYIDIKAGLDNDVIYSLEVDNDQEIWLSTNKGISLITLERKILNFNVNDGLQGDEFNTNASTKSINGDLYFGGLSGISKFNPSKVKDLKEVNNPIITKLKILPHGDEKGFELEYPFENLYELNYLQCNFIISFASINYTNPENNFFYYKLEGYNHEWIKVNGDPEVQFMNLEEGVYDFKIRSALRNGELSKNITSLKIKINPPLYKSFLFKIGAFSILFILGGLIYRARIKSVENRNVKLQEIVDDQTKKLKRANNLQKLFLKEVPEPFVIFNTEGEITFANELYTSLILNGKPDSIDKNIAGIEIDNSLLMGIKKITEEKLNKFESELTIGIKDFQLKFNRIIVDDRDYGTAVLLRDVTSIKKAELVLKQNEFLFRSYFEKSPIGIVYIVNPKDPISNCNDKFCEMMGMDREMALTKTMMDFTYPEDLKSNIKSFQKAFDNKVKYLFEPNKRLLCVKNSVVMTETHMTFIYDEEGNYQYMFALIHDVTEQRDNQKKLIEARTKLIQSEKMASLGQITAGVAHEINNPVNFIYNGVNNLKSLVSTLKKNENKDVESVYQDIQQMIDAVEDGAKRTAEIVKSLRLFTREDANSLVNYDIITGIESTITLLSNRLSDGITIKTDYDIEEQFINCYPGQLNQVFMNVIMNAIESIEKNGSIEVKLNQTDSFINVIIKDTGSGISPSITKKIFEPFFSTKGPKSGTGLGLSISASIMEKHNGRIFVEQNHPQGTICTISIPY